MKKINVLWIVDHLGFNGIMHGAGKYYLTTIPYFDNNKFNITLCVLRGKDHLTKLFEDVKINVVHLGRGKIDPRTLFDLRRMIKDLKIDLIHTHGYGSDNFGRIIGKLLGIPSIIHAHDDNRNYPWHQQFADFILKPFTVRAIAVSDTVKQSCVLKRKVIKDKLTVLHNGIELNHFILSKAELVQKEKEKFGIKNNIKVIGAVGRLRKEKGIKYLIESAPKVLSSFPDTIFLIAGDGPEKNELQDLAKNLGIGNKIIFAGFISNIPMILSLMDIFVSPSLTEGSPLGILEAMAMNKPIVASNVGGIKEILVNEKTGLLVPAQDPNAISDKIIYLLKNAPVASALAKNAHEASKNYDINLCVKKLENYYLNLLSR